MTHNDVRDLIAHGDAFPWPEASQYDKVLIIAHRGAASVSPWNSCDAIRDAKWWGADGVELDIRRSADGVLYLFHDDCLDLHTDSVGSPSHLSYREMCELQHRSDLGEFIDASPPPLVDALDLCAELGLKLHLDVKEPGLEDEIAYLLSSHGLWNQVVSINTYNAQSLIANPHYRELEYKGPLYLDREEYFARPVREVLDRPGKMVIVDDPRYVAAVLGRSPKLPSVRTGSRPRGGRRRTRDVAPLPSVREAVEIARMEAVADAGASLAADRVAVHAILESAKRAQAGATLDTVAALVVDLAAVGLSFPQRPDWRTDGVVETSALRALGDLGAADGVSAAADVLESVEEIEKHKFGTHFAGETGGRPGWWRIRDEAIRTVGRCGGPRGATVLIEYLKPDRVQQARSGNPRLAGAALGLIWCSGSLDGTAAKRAVENALDGLPRAAKGSFFERQLNATRA